MGRGKNEEMLNAVHEVLAEDATLSYAQIASRLATRGYPEPPRQTVVSWVRQLRAWNLIDEHHVSRVEPLMPAYLFLDLPARSEPRVRRMLQRENVSGQVELITGTVFNVVIRTQVRRSSALEGLRRACLTAGATDARAAVVLRRAPPLIAAS